MADKNEIVEKQDNSRHDDKGEHGDDRHDDRRDRPGQIIHPRPTHGESAVRARLAREADAMLECFPWFSFHEGLSSAGVTGVWRGKVQPVRRTEDVRLLLDDLAHDRAIYRLKDELKHLPTCKEVHCTHPWMDNIGSLQVQFDLKMTYLGNEALPRCYVLSPEIPPEKRKHMWADGAVCAFLASDGTWDHRTSTVADFLPHVLVWLVKWLVFDSTQVWIGAQHFSSPLYHLAFVDRNDPCWCGSGRIYRKCCRIKDQVNTGLVPSKRVLRAAALQAPKWLRSR